MEKKFYITTTLPYVNAAPHIGFALEIIQADVLARHKLSLGSEVFFNTGTDEHGLKIYQKAQELGITPQQYCDEASKNFRSLKEKLNLSFNSFVRTTDDHHVKAAQEFWRRCSKNGDIYKQKYKAKYCVGCELEKTDSELVDGRCPIHPNKDVEIIEEENYFFRFSKYQQPLLDFYASNPDFVVPDGRFNEIKSFVKSGLKDFSVSRQKEKMPWGIPVPGDEEQVMYVWFDALVNYASCLGWPSFAEASEGRPSFAEASEDKPSFETASEDKPSRFEEFWGAKGRLNALQVAGKDNLRQQTAMWQAMLISAGLPNTRQVFIHGFITSNGQKMSKSLGNVVDPADLVDKYGIDPVRYYLLRELPPTEDGDFTYEKFEERYNADLAKGLGNLASRIVTVAKKAGISAVNDDAVSDFSEVIKAVKEKSRRALDNYKFNEALASIWELAGFCDRYIEKKQPWKTQDKGTINNLLFALREIAELIGPFLPGTSEKIKSMVANGETVPLFPRIEKK